MEQAFQWFKWGKIEGTNERGKIVIPPKETSSELPDTYSVVPYVEHQTNKLKVPWRPKLFDTSAPISEDELAW